MPDTALTVSQLNTYIKDVVEAGFPQPVWVCGEIQGFSRNRGRRHCYFELIEKDEATQTIRAKISMALFANRKAAIHQVLSRAENQFELKDDIEVKFLCKVNFYPPYGSMTLIVEDIDPAYTLGKFAQEKQRLIAILKERGTLEKNKRHSLPIVPLTLGLITADDSAAYNDFISELSGSGFGFRVILRRALVQGKAAEADIANAIQELQAVPRLDLIVITRGGGSVADLSCFDSERIAEAIAACPIPVVTGIGHEIDLSVTDLAAHTYRKTPTALAQWLVEEVRSYLEKMDEGGRVIFERARQLIQRRKDDLFQDARQLQTATTTFMVDHRESLVRLKESLRLQPSALLQRSRSRLKDRAVRFQTVTNEYLRGHREGLLRYRMVLSQRPPKILALNKEVIHRQIKETKRALASRWERSRNALRAHQKVVEILDPSKTLRRGFTITRTRSGRLLRHTDDVKPGERLETELAEGVVRSRVLEQQESLF